MSIDFNKLICPNCGYYCLGNGGVGCINKPLLLSQSKKEDKLKEEFKEAEKKTNELIREFEAAKSKCNNCDKLTNRLRELEEFIWSLQLSVGDDLERSVLMEKGK